MTTLEESFIVISTIAENDTYMVFPVLTFKLTKKGKMLPSIGSNLHLTMHMIKNDCCNGFRGTNAAFYTLSLVTCLAWECLSN